MLIVLAIPDLPVLLFPRIERKMLGHSLLPKLSRPDVTPSSMTSGNHSQNGSSSSQGKGRN